MKTTVTCFWAALASLFVLVHPALGEQKTVKQCNDEWRANKSAIQASGKTKRVFVAECRGVPVAQPNPKPKPAVAEGRFATEADAKASCPGDPIVWVNLSSGIYHASNSKSYGKTKNGAYMCEKDSAASGFRAPKASNRV